MSTATSVIPHESTGVAQFDRARQWLARFPLSILQLGMRIGVGAVFWAVGVAPFVALTRPTDLGESLDYLIMRPVRYTFVDPLGHH